MKSTNVPASEAARLRVVKKLPPHAKGALKLAQQFGEALMCVRHRVDAKAQFRYTTVELLVDKAAIRPRKESIVGVRIGPDEYALQKVVKAAGARWDPDRKVWHLVWHLPKRLLGILRLTGRLSG